MGIQLFPNVANGTHAGALEPAGRARPKWVYIFATASGWQEGSPGAKMSACMLRRAYLAFLVAAGIAALALMGLAQEAPATGAYRVIKTAKVGGAGGFDYIYADADGRKLYIPRTGNPSRVTVFNLDTLEPVGEISNTSAHGAAVSTKSGHGFATSRPVAMWDTKTMLPIKTIDVQGGPDGILYDSFNDRVYILSHSAPNATVINAADGAVLGTIDLGGAPEQAATDGKGHIYVDIEDKGNIAVVDAKTMLVTDSLRSDGQGRHVRRAGHGCQEQHPFRGVPQPADHGDPERD